jgi:hypothetical protein
VILFIVLVIILKIQQLLAWFIHRFSNFINRYFVFS